MTNETATEVLQSLDDPSCGRTGPLLHWTKEALMSREARAAWLPPDREPLPLMP